MVSEEKKVVLGEDWPHIRVVSHQVWSPQGGLLRGCSPIRVVTYQGDLLLGWYQGCSLIRDGLSSGWSLIRVVSDHGGLPSE